VNLTDGTENQLQQVRKFNKKQENLHKREKNAIQKRTKISQKRKAASSKSASASFLQNLNFEIEVTIHALTLIVTFASSPCAVSKTRRQRFSLHENGSYFEKAGNTKGHR
jgi:hypothetical protein